jgi:hypothetical protein
MDSIYHGVPTRLRGTTLYPLNRLRDLYPDIYEGEIAKYQDHPDRILLPQTRLPVLDCFWNDVVHTAPIHPHRLYREWTARGADVDPDRAFFRIPIDRVAKHEVGWMIGRDVQRLDVATYAELTIVPEETRRWYDRLAARGRHGADFVGVPHVLIKGEIDIAGLDVIRWADPST